MSIPAHIEGRSKFFEALNELFRKGCAQWQSKREGYASVERFRRAGRKLAVSTFLREEYSDASRKFWEAGRNSVEKPELRWVTSEVAFEHLITRLRRLDGESKRKEKKQWFESKDLDNLESEWERYWDVERRWLLRLTWDEDVRESFARTGGRRIIGALLAGSDEFRAWQKENIEEPYLRNKYVESVQTGEGLLLEAMTIAEKMGAVERANAAKHILDALVSVNSVRLNVAGRRAGHLAHEVRRRFTNAYKTGEIARRLFPQHVAWQRLCGHPHSFWRRDFGGLVLCLAEIKIVLRSSAIDERTRTCFRHMAAPLVASELLRIRQDIILHGAMDEALGFSDWFYALAEDRDFDDVLVSHESIQFGDSSMNMTLMRDGSVNGAVRELWRFLSQQEKEEVFYHDVAEQGRRLLLSPDEVVREVREEAKSLSESFLSRRNHL